MRVTNYPEECKGLVISLSNDSKKILPVLMLLLFVIFFLDSSLFCASADSESLNIANNSDKTMSFPFIIKPLEQFQSDPSQWGIVHDKGKVYSGFNTFNLKKYSDSLSIKQNQLKNFQNSWQSRHHVLMPLPKYNWKYERSTWSGNYKWNHRSYRHSSGFKWGR